MASEPRTTISCAALERSDGYLFILQRPNRHHDIIEHLVNMRHTDAMIASCRQGFMTDGGRFVDRHEAKRIAHLAGQLKGETHPTELFSEDVW